MIVIILIPGAQQSLRFNFIRDVAPIASIARTPLVMVVNPSVPAKTVPELITYAKAHPGTLNMGSGGTGTSLHVAGELFKMMAQVDLFHVPYRGGAPALAGLLGGQVQVMFDTLPGTLGHVKARKLRALAVTAETRQTSLPDIPSMDEFLPGYEARGWYGLVVPTGTPADIVDKLNQEVNSTLAESKIETQLAELGAMKFAGTPAAFGDFIATETQKWAKVVDFAGIKAE